MTNMKHAWFPVGISSFSVLDSTGNHACFILVILNYISLYTRVLSTFQQHLVLFPTIISIYIIVINETSHYSSLNRQEQYKTQLKKYSR